MTGVPTVLDERFRRAAAASGELDVGFDPEPEAELERLARHFGPRVLRTPKALDGVRRELDEYFAGRRHAFDIELDLHATPEFHRRVLAELNRVEYGHTTTYG